MIQQWDLVIDFLGRPLLMNAVYAMEHWKRSKVKKPWFEAGIEVARLAKLPKGLDLVEFEFQARYAHNILPDVEAIVPSVKACIDGFVSYGLIVDDDPTHVHAITLLRPRHVPKVPDALLVRITAL